MRHPIDPAAPIMARLHELGIPARLPRDRFLVYRFVHGDRLLYVGVTCSPRGRWVSHKRTAGWWQLVTHVLLEWHPDENSALRSEVAAIRTEAPEFNIRSAKFMRSSCAPHELPARNVPLSLSRSRSKRGSERRDVVPIHRRLGRRASAMDGRFAASSIGGGL